MTTLHAGRPEQQACLDGFGISLNERIKQAIELLREYEPPEGYYLAFSGGKDSCAIKELAHMAGVKFEARYNNTTIDPPELVRFIKRAHPDVPWNQPKYGNMFYRIATSSHTPPTRRARWCCEEYKECGGAGRVKVMGVRAAESRNRAKNWREVTGDLHRNPVVCPVVYWADEQVWQFIRGAGIPYCELYDEGWKRLGCVGCPLNPESQKREFERWPKYRDRWHWAVIENWKRWRDIPNTKTGEPRMHARFATGETFWEWWLNERRPDVFHDGCQSGLLWTNEDAA